MPRASEAHFAGDFFSRQTQDGVRYIVDVPRRPTHRGVAAKLDSIVDGVEFLSAEQVASQCGSSTDLVYHATKRGFLCPGKIGTQFVYTARDVSRWRALRSEHAITSELQKGSHPVDVYLEGGNAWSLDDVTTVLHRWAKLTGAWVIEGPRGSFARWLQRLGLVRITPRQMRRVIELLLADAYVRQRAELAVTDLVRTSERDLAEAGETAAEPGFTHAPTVSTDAHAE